jgi:hypothetical protein
MGRTAEAALGAALTGQTLAEAAVPSTALPTAAALARGFLRPLHSLFASIHSLSDCFGRQPPTLTSKMVLASSSSNGSK